MTYAPSVFQCGHFFNFGALEINIRICIRDKKHSMSVLPQLELRKVEDPGSVLFSYFIFMQSIKVLDILCKFQIDL